MPESIKQVFIILAEQFHSAHIIIDIIDILFVAVVIFGVVKFIRDRRASKLATGVLLIILLMVLSKIINMRALNFLFENIIQVGFIAIIIVFQPELRSALEKFGGVSFIKNISESKSSQTKHSIINTLCESAGELSREYTGALIVIERSTPLGDIIKTGTVINSDASVSLIKNIFFNKAPLHDGAMIIRSGRLYAAGCFLPLTTKDDIVKDLGTRHRAAIGMSENSDAIVIVVSEETGTISLAVDGQLRRNYDYNTLKAELSNLLRDEDNAGKHKKQ